MLPENITAVVVRNERWTGSQASPPYEAGWAHEAIIFVRALTQPEGATPQARVEISADGMHWMDEGTTFPMPSDANQVTGARVKHFGNFIRISTTYEPGAECTVLVAFHVKA